MLKREIEVLENAKDDMKITVSYDVRLSKDEVRHLIEYKQNEVSCKERQLERMC